MRNVNFALRANVFVPRRVNVVSVSTFPVLVDVFPEFRDDLFFVAEDQIVFLSPDRRIVDVVPVGEREQLIGSSSDVLLSTAEVREVQQVLVDDGFDVEINGVFDTRTREALISFQRRRGLRAHGIVNTRTVAALGLSNRISQSHIRSASRSSTTTGQAETQRRSTERNAGVRRGQQNAEGSRSRSTVGQGGAERQPNVQRPSNRSTTGQGRREGPSTSGQGRMQRSAPPQQSAPNR